VGKLLQSLAEKERRAEIVFLDPPYEEADEYEATLTFLGQNHATVLGDGAVVVAEHAKKRPLAARYGVIERVRVLEQGDAALSFYRRD
jgi:16S rRNA G966 N2-methylase RsmD